jgi:hypothetical protein
MANLPPSRLPHGNPSYLQKPWLKFADESLEKRYTLDCAHPSRLLKLLAKPVFVSVLVLLLGLTSWTKLCFTLAVLATTWVVHRGELGKVAGVGMALVPVFLETVDSAERTVVVFLPSFICGLMLKDCTLSAVCMVLTALLTLACHSASCVSVFLVALLYTALTSFIERDFRDIWAKMDSYRRAYKVHYDLFNSGENEVFITKPNTEVVYLNAKAKSLAKSMGKDLSQPIELSSVISMDGDALQTAVERSLKGVTIELELDFSLEANGSPKDVRVFLAKISPISWRQANCAKISLTDISSVSQQRLLVLRQTKEVAGSLKLILREIESAYLAKEPLMANDIYRLYTMQHSLVSNLNYQMLTLRGVEWTCKPFNLRQQVIGKIEETAYKALLREVELRLTYEMHLPRIVSGDSERTAHLVKTLVEFSSKQAKAKSIIQLTCEYHVSPMQKETAQVIDVKLTLSFTTSQLSQAQLSRVLALTDSDASLQELAELYGLSMALLPSMLSVVSGKVLTSYIKEGAVNRAYISLM